MGDLAPSTNVDLNRFWTPPAATTDSVSSLRESLSELPHPPLQISRVAQLDAELLDTELEHLLVAPIRTTLASLPVSHSQVPFTALSPANRRLRVCRAQQSTSLNC